MSEDVAFVIDGIGRASTGNWPRTWTVAEHDDTGPHRIDRNIQVYIEF